MKRGPVSRAIRAIDRLLGGRIRRFWLRTMVLGGGWGEFIDEVAAAPRGTAILDLGAGEAELRARVPHARYVAVDLAVGHGSWDYSALDVVADALASPFADATFDLVVCKQVLEHVPDPIRLLREVHRVLRPGGRIVLSTNQAWPQHQQPHDYFRFTSFALEHCITAAGLRTERMQAMGGAFSAALFHFSQTLSPHIWSKTPRGNAAARAITRPFGLVFRALMPLVSALDKLDRTKDNTLGWYVWARKPEG